MLKLRVLVFGALLYCGITTGALAQDSNQVRAKQNPLAALQTLFGGGREGVGAGGGRGTVLVEPEVQALGTALGFQLKLIQPTTSRTTDPAIAEVSQALTGLFSFPGYTVLDQSWVAMDYSGTGAARGQVTRATLRLNGKGVQYALEVWVDSLSATAVRVFVRMSQQGAYSQVTKERPVVDLFSTTVVVGFNKTIVLGATHPLPSTDLRVEIPSGVSMPQAQALQSAAQKKEAELPLILTIRPERRGN